MKDLLHSQKISQVLTPAVKTTTQTSAEVDMQGFESLNVLFSIGQSGDTLSGSVKWTLKLEHSDTTSTGFTDVDAAGVFNSAATVVIDAAAEDEAVYTLGYKGGKQFVRAVATATGTHSTGTPMAILAVQGDASLNPAA